MSNEIMTPLPYQGYNPDILNCLADLSSDEVFTPPDLANRLLDQLPESLWSDPAARFLDPACKSGIFLREIVKRLFKGLASQIPDPQSRANHIFTTQVFGYALTELTALMSRRSVYGSKIANGARSICTGFADAAGNIKLPAVSHNWENGKCSLCRANQGNYDRAAGLESHAYPFIHLSLQELSTMRFDVIIGNPPYQLSTNGSGAQATPLYQKFVQQAIKLNPRYLTMIIPSRWFSGGMGLDSFRKEMLNDKRISHIVDFTNSKDCFKDNSISGGVNYFLWDRDYHGDCDFTSNHNNGTTTVKRPLNEYDFMVRYNDALPIIRKVKDKSYPSISEIVSSINPFGFPTSERGDKEPKENSSKIYHSKGHGFVKRDLIKQSLNLIDSYKVMLSQTTSEHAGEARKDGTFRLFSTIRLLKPNEISTFSYIVLGNFNNELEAKNFKAYLETRLFRFLVMQYVSSIHLSKDSFQLVPLLPMTEVWDDKRLYAHFELTQDEIDFIERLIRPME